MLGLNRLDACNVARGQTGHFAPARQSQQAKVLGLPIGVVHRNLIRTPQCRDCHCIGRTRSGRPVRMDIARKACPFFDLSGKQDDILINRGAFRTKAQSQGFCRRRCENGPYFACLPVEKETFGNARKRSNGRLGL